ncbi:sugar porter family MFS transporter [Klenkia sp. LSe6-5]|uniref:Sugar porter family MFS transporter n=1 Tax=Klenkia sesuvii TaxID=3103137 RepID=A0ABU8DXZ1_9ACTN
MPATQAHGSRTGLGRITAIATLGGLLFGYDTGVISGALLYMRDDLDLTSLSEATVVSSLLFGAIFGALLGGRLADQLGRRGSLLVCAVLFLVGAVGTGLAPNVEVMVAARIVLGLAVGAAAATVPLYLAEMSPAARRGRIVTINELMIVSGQMLAFTINAVLDAVIDDTHVWRIMLLVAAVPAIGLLIGMLLLPDSPRWYALRGRDSEARAVLERTRPSDEAAAEYTSIVELAAQERARARGAALQQLRDNPWMRRLLWIGCGLAVAQQATGINTVIYYAPTILESTGLAASASLVATVAVGVISVTMTVLGIWLLGFVRRRTLLLTGFTGVAASQAVLALVFLLPQSTTASYTVLAAMVLFVAFVQCFIGIGVWLLLSEIFPIAIRGFAMGISVAVLWATNTLISFAFPLLNAGVGATWTFGLFVVVNLVSIAFVRRFVPETKGRTLESLEQQFQTGEHAVVSSSSR